MTKKQKIKNWLKNHPDQVGAITATLVGTSMLVALIAASVQQQKTAVKKQKDAIAAHNTWADNFTQWINDETVKGNFIYQLGDGSYLTVPASSEQVIVRK